MTCQVCNGPLGKNNKSGICTKRAECRQKKSSLRWQEYGPTYKDRRAGLDAARREDPSFCQRQLQAVQDFKTRPENTDRIRAYNKRGRERYMARADRPCLSPDGCSEHAKVGSKYCPEHLRVEANRHYHRTAAERRQELAERQQWICPWCSDYLPPSLCRTHVDHIIPRASGLVIEEDWNFQILHGRCNQEKSDRITDQAIALAAEHGLALAA